MGLFPRKNEDDFLTQQAKEEGRLTDFEECSQAEIHKSKESNEGLRTLSFPATQNPPPDMMTTGITSGIEFFANHVRKQMQGDDCKTDEFDTNNSDMNYLDNPPDWRCKPDYMKPMSFGPQDVTRAGIGAAVLLFGFAALFDVEILGLFALLIIIAVFSNKFKKH